MTLILCFHKYLHALFQPLSLCVLLVSFAVSLGIIIFWEIHYDLGEGIIAFKCKSTDHKQHKYTWLFAPSIVHRCWSLFWDAHRKCQMDICNHQFCNNLACRYTRWKEKKVVEEPGFEPGTFRMRSGHSTTELHPLIYDVDHPMMGTTLYLSFISIGPGNQQILLQNGRNHSMPVKW